MPIQRSCFRPRTMRFIITGKMIPCSPINPGRFNPFIGRIVASQPLDQRSCGPPTITNRTRPLKAERRIGLRIGRFERSTRRPPASLPTGSLCRLRGPFTSECFSPCRCLHEPLRLLPGAPVAGQESHPLGGTAFLRRTCRSNLAKKVCL